MYDPDRRDTLIDSQLFVAAILLSMLVYNTTIAIDEHAIDQLSFVSQLSQSIVVKQGNSPLANLQAFQHIFPSLCWVVRDFSLDLAEHKSPRTTFCIASTSRF
jgi:hypothetical protein